MISLSHGGRRYRADEFSIFGQEPYRLVKRTNSKAGVFSSQEWFAYFWSVCGLHECVVNPPSTCAWGTTSPERLLKSTLSGESRAREIISSRTDRLMTVWDEEPDSVLFMENLSTYYRKFSTSRAELKKWGRKAKGRHGVRVFHADHGLQLQQVFVGERVFTIRNELDYPVESAEHQMLCEKIRDCLEPLKIGFYSVSFHEAGGTLRVSAVHRDVPYYAFEVFGDDVFGELTDVLGGVA